MIMVALGGLTLTTLTGCKDKDAGTAGANAMPPATVKVMNLQRQDINLESVWFGHLRGVEEAGIRPEVSGKLLRQVYTDGSLCKKGDVLFEIDPATYKAAVDQCVANVAAAKASVLQAKASDDRARQDVDRYKPLVKNGTVSEKTYTDAVQTQKETEAALYAAEAQVKQSEAALETARINLDRCSIKAPFTGLAGNATVSVGDYITANSAALTTMSSVNPIRVDFTVPGKEMLNAVLAASYNPESGDVSPIEGFKLILEDGTTYNREGRVVAIDSQVNANTASVNFIGNVPNDEYRLRSGAAVRVCAKTDEIKDAILVPVRAVTTSMNHHMIYVVAADNTPYGIDVKLGKNVTLDMPDGKGGKAPMAMQVITGNACPLEDHLKALGIDKLTDAQVIVEGTQMAARYSMANAAMRAQGVKEGLGKVVAQPFEYEVPRTTTPSVTAKQESEGVDLPQSASEDGANK